MREAHRLRERIELSLDDRQVAALAVGALLLLAGMFALGLLVGMQVARRSPQPAPLGDLAALDAQRTQAQRMPAAAAAETKAQGSGAPTQSAGVAPAIEQPAQDAPAVASPPARVDPPVKKEIPAPPSTVSVAPSRTVAVAPAETDAPLPPPPSRLGAYTVQLAATQHRIEALQLASRAEAAGLKPYVVEARLPAKGGVWYRVRVGAFADRRSAERYRRDVDRELRTSAVVMPTR
jgi:DedD protein